MALAISASSCSRLWINASNRSVTSTSSGMTPSNGTSASTTLRFRWSILLRSVLHNFQFLTDFLASSNHFSSLFQSFLVKSYRGCGSHSIGARDEDQSAAAKQNPGHRSCRDHTGALDFKVQAFEGGPVILMMTPSRCAHRRVNRVTSTHLVPPPL